MSEVKYFWELMQGTDEWKNARQGLVTASEVKKIVTSTGKVSDSEGSRDAAYEILAQRLNPRLDDVEFYNGHMERGHTFEPFARDLYSENNEVVRECGIVIRDFGDYKIGFSPDGLVGDDGIIEIKCPTKTKHVREICLDQPPKEHMLQMQTGLLVTGRKWCDYISHYNGMHQRVYRVEPDYELHDAIKAACYKLELFVQEKMKVYKEKTQYFNLAKYEEAI